MIVERTGYNNLSVEIYSSGSTRIIDPGNELALAESIRFSTVYPGGIYADASFVVPRDVTRALPFKHAQRVVIRNGLILVWEGWIADITYDFGQREQVEAHCLGYVALMFNRYKYNRWIDRRFGSHIFGVWDQLDLSANDRCHFDRTDRLRLEPKREQWTNGDVARLRWDSNAGSNAKRVKFDFDFSEIDESTPDGVKNDGLVDQTNAYDGNAATSITITFNTGQFFYVGSRETWNRARFDFGATVNANVSTLTVEYHNGTVWGAVPGMTDGTSLASKTWAQDGVVSFTIPADWDPDTLLGSTRMYWIRMSVSANLTANIIINEIYTGELQAWEFQLYDLTNAISLWNTTTTGTGSQDITLGTSAARIEFRLYARATQRPTGSGIYGEITNLRVLCENGSGVITTTVEDILKACIDYLDQGAPTVIFSTSVALIGANTFDMEAAGLTQDDLSESIGAFMTRVAKFSATNAAYSVGVRESEAIAGETKPVIYYEQQPALTDYDYVLSITDQNLRGGRLVASAFTDTLKTWVMVVFRDDRGREQWSNAARDTTLANKYLDRALVTRAGSGITTVTAGDDYGNTILNQLKKLQYYVEGPVPVLGFVLDKNGQTVPASQVRSGKRLKVTDFLADFGDETSGGFTFLIQRTEYDDASETISLTLGRPIDLSAVVASAYDQ